MVRGAADDGKRAGRRSGARSAEEARETLFPAPRFLLARAAVGVCVAVVILLQRPAPTGIPHTSAALGLLAWVAAGTALGLARDLLARHPRQALGGLLSLDTAAAAAVIWTTGGHDQPALLLLTLPIFAGALVLQWRAGLILGLEAGLLYEGMALLTGSAPPGFSGLWSGIAYHAAIFVAIGLVAGLLGERIAVQRREADAARAELADVQLSTERIVECLGCGLIALDAAGRVRKVNRAARRMLGLGEATGGEGDPLGERNAPLARLLREAERDGSGERESEVQLHGPRRSFPALVRIAPVAGTTGEPRGFVALFWDLTDRRRHEEAARRRERLAAVGELAAGLAHEIRNSLKPITGCIELIEKRGDLPATLRPMMEIITREADSLEAFLSQFLTLSRDKNLKLESIDLEELIEREASALILADPGRQGRIAVSGGGGVRLTGDREWLRQVFRNLLLNGLEAAPRGTVRVTFEARRRRGEPWMRIGIHDEGPGFGRLDYAEALKPFRSGKANGTGLGLPTALRGVREHGGRIRLGRRQAEGTTLWVELPQEPARQRQCGRPAA